jgi:hypothetical protein
MKVKYDGSKRARSRLGGNRVDVSEARFRIAADSLTDDLAAKHHAVREGSPRCVAVAGCSDSARRRVPKQPVEIGYQPEGLLTARPFDRVQNGLWRNSAPAVPAGGTFGNVPPSYQYESGSTRKLSIGATVRVRSFPVRDQFAREISYFADCVLHSRNPRPSGLEGLRDVRIIDAIHRSLRTRRPVALKEV